MTITAHLLTTKLHIPPPRSNVVPRPRLIERLDEGLRRGHRLTLVSAPAGFGKTTLVTEWICGSAREVAWVSLDEGDNDPVQFLNYLVAALQQVDGGIGRPVQQILQSPQLPPTQGLITPLINAVTAVGTALTLVLDDYQLISAAAVHQMVQFLVEHQPPKMHVVISTREDPPLPLAQLHARGQVTEIRERALRFTAEEATAFLNQAMGLSLSVEAVIALEAHTEGWIAGLQLAAVALQKSQEDADTFIAAGCLSSSFTGDNRYVMDYLVTEVLERQPEAMRNFLRQTAILDRLTASLCDAVTGRQDSQAMLEQLEGANLFLIPLDHRHAWYRYHQLFGEVMRTTLDPEEEQLLHQRAARWYEAHGYMSPAINHALVYGSESGDLDDAERLVCLAAEETIHSGNLMTVRGWLDALPDARVRASGALATYKGWVLALTGDMALAKNYAEAAEARLRQACPERGQGVCGQDIHGGRAEAATYWGQLLALRSFIAVLYHQDYPSAIELATGALQALSEDQAHWRVIALWTMAESQERTRNITEAIATLREARRTGRTLRKQIFAAAVDVFLASALNAHGQRREAIAICEDTINRYTDDAGRPSPVAGLAFSRLGTLEYEANQLDLAREHLDKGVALGEQLALRGDLVFSYGLSALTLHAQGETDAALKAVQKAYQFAVQTGLSDAEWPLALEANIRMQQGDIPFARRWAEKAGLSPEDAPGYLRIEQHLAYSRLLLAQGRLSDARRWLARLEHFTQERGLYRWLITVHILQALTAERSGDLAVARDLLSQALEIAAPENYTRAFLDEDERIIPLLADVRDVAPSFVDQLLDGAAIATPQQEIAARPLIEPLSERELEVLGLIAAGLSNREIAQELVIALGTVKRHINNIYGKLSVHRRTEAVAVSRDLGLI